METKNGRLRKAALDYGIKSKNANSIKAQRIQIFLFQPGGEGTAAYSC